MIDSFSFGRIVVNGHEYTSDLIIFPDKINGSWWRDKGHWLQKSDLSEVFKEKPDILIIGTGSAGFLKVSERLVKEIEHMGIEVYVGKTANAVEQANLLFDKKKVVAAFHLTC